MRAYIGLSIRNALLGFSPMNRRRAGQSKGRAILSFVGYTVLMLYLYAILVAMEVFLFRSFRSLGEPEGLIALTYLLCTATTLFLTFFQVLSGLFFSKDIELVSALPISSRGLLTGKLSVVALTEAGIAYLVCLPALVLYGVEVGAGVLFYLKGLLFIPFLPLVPLALSVALAFVLIRVSALWKRRESLTIVFSFLLFAGIMYGQMRLSASSASDEAFSQMLAKLLLKQRFLVDTITGFYPPIRWLSDATLQTGWQAWGLGLLFALLSVCVSAAVVWLFGASYQRVAIRQGEVFARQNAQRVRVRDRGVRSPFRALLSHELREIVKTPAYATNCLMPLVVFPALIAVTYFSMRDSMGELAPLLTMLTQVPAPYIIGVEAAALSMFGSMNMTTATSVSREGKRRYFALIIPVKGQTQLLSKLTMGMLFSAASILLACVAALVILPALWLETLCAAGIALIFSLASMSLGLVQDVYHPKLDWRTETEAVKQNFNGMIVMFGSMGVLALLIFLAIKASQAGLSAGAMLALGVALIALAAALALYWLLGRASARYLCQIASNK